MATAPTTGIGATPVLANIETRGASQQIAPAAGSEQRLIDYIAHLQSQGVTNPSFSNPQALVGEAMKSLKGYFERANGMNDHLSVKGKRMDKSEDAALAGQSDAQSALPSGPAGEKLEPASAEQGQIEGAGSVTVKEIERLSDMLAESMRFCMETNIVGTGVANVSKSVMTLIRGQ
ncbi:MAG TPA: hypothetical protein VH858_07225 [Hyphomicrobiales bacterium]|jgi:hypothetical protein